MSLLCCCHSHHPTTLETQPGPTELPVQPPRVRLSNSPSRPDADMYFPSLTSSRGRSQVITPTLHSMVDPEIVDVEDSDDEEGATCTRVSSHSTLEAIRMKLIRPFSSRADSKSVSHLTSRSSNEDTARRAELKRFMHKRIQEELKSEEPRELSKPESPKRSKPETNDQFELPGSGPRDNIEFSVSPASEKEVSTRITSWPDTSLLTSWGIEKPQSAVRRRGSYPESVRKSAVNSTPDRSVSLNERSPTGQPPSRPPRSLAPSLGAYIRRSSSLASLCLSFSASQLDSYLDMAENSEIIVCTQSPQPRNEGACDDDSVDGSEPESPQKALTVAKSGSLTTEKTSENFQFNNSTNQHEESAISFDQDEINDDRYSPLDMWLRTQELQGVSILSSRPGSQLAFKEVQESTGRLPPAPGARAHTEARESLKQEELPNDPSPESRESTRSSWQPSIVDKKGLKEYSIASPSSETLALRNVMSRMGSVFDQEVALSQDASSKYPTRPNSLMPTPAGSRLSIAELLMNGAEVLQSIDSTHATLGPYGRISNEGSVSTSFKTVRNITPSSEHPRISNDTTRQHAPKTISISVSESTSFKQREEELKSIEKRFGSAPTRQKLNTPMYSKFREEFNGSGKTSGGTSSLISKLYTSFPKRVKASISRTQLRRSSTPRLENRISDSRNTQNTTTMKQGGPSLAIEERTAVESQFVTRPDADDGVNQMDQASINSVTHNTTSYSLKSPVTVKNGTRDGKLQVDTGEPQLSIGSRALSSAATDRGSRRKSWGEIHHDISKCVCDEWMDQLYAEDTRSQSGAVAVPPKQRSRKLKTPPPSWARWPSHTRSDRTASAGENDKVQTKDFGVVDSSPLREEDDKGLSKGTSSPRSLSSQIGKALALTWNKITMHKGSSDQDLDIELKPCNSRLSRNSLEYPELELQPMSAGGYKEVQALGHQIDMMKRRSMSDASTVWKSNNNIMISPLVASTTSLRYEGKERRSSEHITSSRTAASPMTPGVTEPSKRPKSCATELFETPQSHFSYEDCVQTQMLEEDENIDPHAVPAQTLPAVLKRARSNIEDKSRQHATTTPRGKDHLQVGWKPYMRKHGSSGCMTPVRKLSGEVLITQ
ncbi:hypothetical protein F5Y16DRAFT_398284 [Xylariaceae sp. FL0255]|nr:hypothetical protein F5Y16DRAFT_398284 [Xylariaceae sp. FL0255]